MDEPVDGWVDMWMDRNFEKIETENNGYIHDKMEAQSVGALAPLKNSQRGKD